MKTPYRVSALACSFALVVLSAHPAVAGPHQVSVGSRIHMDHSVFTEYPFGDDDFSARVAYEYHEKGAYWQLAMDYVWDPSAVGSLDYILTPEINVIFKDNLWRGGLGVLSSYTSGATDDWTDIYWQFLAGIHLPMFTLDVKLDVAYVFKDWGDVSDFDTDDLEYIISASFDL